MKLGHYLKSKNLTQEDCAEETGISQPQISRYLGGAIPGKENMAKLRKWSKGRVGPEDFYPVPEESAS
jgi:transcriptional regulator with XRE-family HTH domain